MDKNSYNNIAKVWQFCEDRAYTRQTNAVREARALAQEAGMPQTSSAQADLLRLIVQLTSSTSIIAIGTASIVETVQLIEGLAGTGQLTAVDSSSQGIALIRTLFHALSDTTQTSLRAVNSPASIFLPRLNANDYDLIVVAGDTDNYAAAFKQAPRLLKDNGAIIFTDVMALENPDSNGGVLNPADRSDKAIAMRKLVEDVQSDDTFLTTLTPSGTGMLIALKR